MPTDPPPTPPPLNVGISCTFTLLGTTMTVSCPSVEQFDSGVLAAQIPGNAKFDLDTLITNLSKQVTVPAWLNKNLSGVSFSIVGWFRRPITDTNLGYVTEKSASYSIQFTISKTSGNLITVLIPDGTTDQIISDFFSISSASFDVSRGTELPTKSST